MSKAVFATGRPVPQARQLFLAPRFIAVACRWGEATECRRHGTSTRCIAAGRFASLVPSLRDSSPVTVTTFPCWSTGLAAGDVPSALGRCVDKISLASAAIRPSDGAIENRGRRRLRL